MNIFANNNYKPNVVERDMYIISNYYKDNGFLDVDVQSQIEYLKSMMEQRPKKLKLCHSRKP